MTTRERILDALRTAGDYISGERLSQQCGITRTAVWKHIQKLQAEGYSIESQRRRGYRLLPDDDVLNESEICRRLPSQFLDRPLTVQVYTSVDSTNQEARRLILQGLGQGTVIVADTQTAGRGRLGRHWESPQGTGIWFSLILEPGVSLQETSQYSFVMAVAVAEGIRQATGLDAVVKWPNDVLLDGKKICGILLELVAEMTQVHQLIVGIGINANQKITDFPPEVQAKATSLAIAAGRSVQRADVLCAVLRAVEVNCQLLQQQGFAAIRDKWTALSCVVGQAVRVVRQGDTLLTGIAEGLDLDGALLVRTAQGVERVLAGDVSLRALDGSYGV